MLFTDRKWLLVNEKIIENIIEITFCFDAMVNEGRIDLDKYSGEHNMATWSCLFREECMKWAKEFEESRPDIVAPDYYNTIWEFAMKKLEENVWLNSTGYWYTERWSDGDLEVALKNADIPATGKNTRKLRDVCRGIFDDKSERNEMIAQMAHETFEKKYGQINF